MVTTIKKRIRTNSQNLNSSRRILILLYLILLWAPTHVSGQEEWLEFTHHSSNDLDFQAGFTLMNPETGAQGIFLLDNRQIHAYGVNERRGIFRKIEVTKKKNMFDNILTKRVLGDYYSLIFHSSNFKQLTFFEFNFRKNTLTRGDLDLNMKGQKVLATFQEGTDVFVLTIHKKDPQLNLYRIDKDYQVHAISYDIGGMEFLTKTGRSSDLQPLVSTVKSKVKGINLNGAPLPVSFGLSSSRSKLYKQDQVLVLTLDHFHEQTQLLSLPMSGEAPTLVNIKKPVTERTMNGYMSNSFWLDGHLAQIAFGKKNLLLSIKNIESGEALFTQTISRGSENVSGINTPLIQKKSWQEEGKELNPNQFFRKIIQDDLAVTLEERKGGYRLMFGGFEKVSKTPSNSSVAAVSFMFGVAGAFIYLPIYEAVSPDYSSYASYASSKVVKASIALDHNFQHQEDAIISPNLFERMEAYVTADKKLAHVLFSSWKDGGILGVYNEEFNTIHLVEF